MKKKLENLASEKFVLDDSLLINTRGGAQDTTSTEQATNSECDGTGNSWSSGENIIDHCDIECGTVDTENQCVTALSGRS